MTQSVPVRPVWSPVMTPFNDDLSIDHSRFVAHCQWLLDNQVGLAIFGTNSEANSLPVGEKRRLIDLLTEAGIVGADMMPGTGSCNLEDCVELTRQAVAVKSAGVLMLPPFYYKGVSDDGLLAFFSEVVERVADPALRIYLYHIPSVAQVPLSLELIARLRDRYPGTFVGIKDSGGDWAFTESLIQAFAGEGFEVFAGSERFLLDTLRAGGAGCISATANVNPAAIAALAANWRAVDADARQSDLNRIRAVFEGYPMIPGMKSTKAAATGHAGWRHVRPPLMALEASVAEALNRQLAEAGFAMAADVS